jgi:hypothetical protein
LEELELWIKNPKNEELFNSFVRTNYAIDYNLIKFDSEKVKARLTEEIAKERKVIKLKKQRIKLYYVAAAVMIGLFTSAYLFKDSLFGPSIYSESNNVISNTIVPGTDKATLTLEDGSVVLLEKGNNYKNQNANSNGEEIVYQADKVNDNHIAYNYLTIPRGGQFHVVLADGTEVWLNSESQLKYPVSFVNGESRIVELVYGEAYFNVSPSTEHLGAKFKVLNKSQEIEVLGTQFNVKAYKDELNIFTTLVEGKVNITTQGGNFDLKPNEQSTLNLQDNNFSIASVNVYNEISWKEGVFSFRRMPLEDIMKALSRWYDIEVDFESPDLKKVGFNGVVGKDQNIKEILDIIKNFGVIKDYEVINKKVIIK